VAAGVDAGLGGECVVVSTNIVACDSTVVSVNMASISSATMAIIVSMSNISSATMVIIVSMSKSSVGREQVRRGERRKGKQEAGIEAGFGRVRGKTNNKQGRNQTLQHNQEGLVGEAPRPTVRHQPVHLPSHSSFP